MWFIWKEARKKNEKESKKKVNPLADTQDIKRNSTSVCLYVDQLGLGSEQKKETTTTIAFAKQSGNNDKKKRIKI